MRIPAGSVADQLGIRIDIEGALPTSGLLIVRTIYPSNEIGIAIGTSPTQSWIDNIGMLRSAEIVIQGSMLVSSIRQSMGDE